LDRVLIINRGTSIAYISCFTSTSRSRTVFSSTVMSRITLLAVQDILSSFIGVEVSTLAR
jgi:hypothetical protein